MNFGSGSRAAGIAFAAVILGCALTAPAASRAANPTQTAPAADALKVAVYPSEGNLDEYSPLELALHLQNPSKQSVEIDSVTLLSPKAYAELAAPVEQIRIAPGDSDDLTVTIKTKPAIPGTYSLVLEVCARFSGARAPCRPAYVQSKITVGIPGVAEAMQYVGIPSLFLLPGALIIITFAALYALLTRRTAVDVKQPILLVWAVGLSFVALPLYEAVTPLIFHARHNYLHGYNLEDLIALWSLSIVVGGALATAATGVYWYRERRYQPHETDTEIAVLRKLYWHRVRHDAGDCHFKLAALQRQPAGGGAGPLLLVLPFGAAEAGKIWIVPRVKLEAGSNANEASVYLPKIRESLEKIDRPDHEPSEDKTLMDLVKRGLASSAIKLHWDDDQTFGPRKVDSADHPSDGNDKALFVHAV